MDSKSGDLSSGEIHLASHRTHALVGNENPNPWTGHLDDSCFCIHVFDGAEDYTRHGTRNEEI